MRARYVAGVAALFLASCAGGESTVDRLGEAFCADLESGMTPAQIIMGAPADTFEGTRDAAAHASLWVEDHCPGELVTNDDLRSFLDANGIDPDDLDG